MALIARIYEPDSRAADRRPLHDGSARGGGRARAARRRSAASRATTARSRSSRARPRSCASSRPDVEIVDAGAGRIGRAVRERWFGDTGRRVPELALEGSLDARGRARAGRRRGRRGAACRRMRQGRRSSCARARRRRSRRRSPGPRSRRCSSRATRAARARPDGADLWLGRSRPTRSWPATSTRDSGASRCSRSSSAVGSVVPWAEPQVGRRRDAGVREPALRPRRARAAAAGPVGRGGRRAPDRGRRRAATSDSSASSTPQGRGATFTGSECHDWAGGRTGAGLRGPGEHPRLRRDGRRARRDLRGAEGLAGRATARASPRRRLPAATVAASSPRRCSSSSGTAATPALSDIARRPARRRPRGADRGAAAALRPARPALRQDAARPVAAGRRRAARRDRRALGEPRLRALADWAGDANLEERVDGEDEIDPVVLDELRRSE